MKRLFSIMVVTLLFSVIFLASVCVAAGPVPIPTTAKWTGTLYNVGVCLDANPPTGTKVMTVNIGQGASSVMGAATFLIVYCIDTTSPSFAGSGWGIITTANGDTIHITIPDLTLDPTKTPPEWSETEVITGGTGKFENAIGSSFSHGAWTSGTDSFPYGTESPPLLLPPQGWVGTSEGEITF